MSILNKLSFIILFLAFTSTAYFFYLLFWPIQTLVPNVQPYKVLTPVVHVGENLVYQVNACKYVNVHAEVIRTFSDGINYPSTTSANNLAVGCHITNISTPVLSYIPPGRYHLSLDAIYVINAFRTEHVRSITEEFTVVK